MRHYEFKIGPVTFGRYMATDREASALVERWVRLFWPRYLKHVAECFPGSMAQAIAEGWHGDAVEVQVGSRSVDGAGVIRFEPYRMMADRKIVQVGSGFRTVPLDASGVEVSP